jgi:hypothetical protein
MSMEEVVAVVTVLGAPANIAMAVAAGFALTLWRKQIAGASHHELAKKLSGALRQVAITRDAALRVGLQGVIDRKNVIRSALAGQSLPDSVRSLDAALHELGPLEGQVAVQWGDEMLDLVAIIRMESAALLRHIDANLAVTRDQGTQKLSQRGLCTGRRTSRRPSFGARTSAPSACSCSSCRIG